MKAAMTSTHCLAVLMTGLTACRTPVGQVPSAATPPAAANRQAIEFQIGFWIGAPAYANQVESYQMMKDMGFTFADGGFPAYTPEDIKKMLECCRQVGLKAMVDDPRLYHPLQRVNDPNWKETYAAVCAEYVNDPSVYGLGIQDEPRSDYFQSMKDAAEIIHKLNPDTFVFANLLPTYATTVQLGTPTYEEYLDMYLKTVKPSVLCYDHYALMADGTIRTDYFENLDLIRKYAQKYNVIPWNTILSWKHLGYAEPSDAQMRWQVYTSMAYGMKGIMYFVYWAPKEWEKDNPYRAIVDYDGKPTRMGEGVRQLNAEMTVLGKTLMQLTSTDVFFTGKIPAGCRRLGDTSIIQLPADKDLMLGFFRDNAGADYVMVVNADTANPVDFEANFKLAYCLWLEGYKPTVRGLAEVSKVDGGLVPITVTNSTAALHLDAGDGKLFKLDTAFEYPRQPVPHPRTR
jgi:hypothetical protein